MTMPLQLSASSGPAISGGAPQDAWSGFMTGNFSGATGSASATGGVSPLLLIGLAVVALLLLRRR